MKGIIVSKHQDEIDLYLKGSDIIHPNPHPAIKHEGAFENWQDVKYLHDLQATQRDLEEYVDSVDEDIIIFVSGVTFTTVPKHSIVSIRDAVPYGYSRSYFNDAVVLIAEVLECA